MQGTSFYSSFHFPKPIRYRHSTKNTGLLPTDHLMTATASPMKNRPRNVSTEPYKNYDDSPKSMCSPNAGKTTLLAGRSKIRRVKI